MTLELLKTRVEAEWIDYNGHMNVAYYHMAFDRATDRFLELLGLGEESARAGMGSMFALEDHLTYQRELRVSDPIRITLQILDRDAKRIHYFLRMFDDARNELAATCEHLSIYVDFRRRRSAVIPPEVWAKLEPLYEAHQSLPAPAEAGRVMSVRRR